MKRLIKKYKEHHDGSLTGLRAYKISGEKVVKYVPLLLDWDEVRVNLKKRNIKLTNLSKRYVTSKIKSSN